MTQQNTKNPTARRNRISFPTFNWATKKRRRASTTKRRLLLERMEDRHLLAVLASWDFTGQSGVDTSTAQVVHGSLDDGGLLTRGTGAPASTGNNSFRTTGFQNDGISTANTDYFQTTFSAAPGNALSFNFIDAQFSGTATFAAEPGVSHQFAYSLDGSDFTLIGSPTVTVGTPATINGLDLTGVSPLQNVSDDVTVTFRYYANGQTATGGWGFNSPSAGTVGLLFDGDFTPVGSGPATVLSPNVSSVNVTEGQPGASFDLSFTELPTSDVTVTITPSNNEVDLGNGPGTALTLTFTVGNATTPQSFTVTAVDDDVVEGDHDSELTFAISSADDDFDSLTIDPITVNITDNDFLSLVAPYFNDFEANVGAAGLGEGWTVFSVDADTSRTWGPAVTSGNRYALANAFGGSAPADDWLISPPFDLDATQDEVVSFQSWTRFTDSGLTHPQLNFLYSTDYSGLGDPTAATWTELPFTPSPADSQEWTQSGDIDVSSISGSQVWFAFQYQSSSTGGDTSTRWQVDDFSLVSTSVPAAVLSPNVSVVGVTEGAPGASFDLSLNLLPSNDVTVTITPSNNEVDLGEGPGVPLVLVFTPANATTPQPFIVTAVDDDIVEGDHDSVLTFSFSSADADFNSITRDPITVNITDNDFPPGLGAVPFFEDFQSFTAAGFAPIPSAGQLNSNIWRVAGMSDGMGVFGGTHTTGDFARGISNGNVTTGGLYAFNTGDGNVIVGFQPTGADFNPGALALRVANETGATVSDWDISYEIWTFNDQPRASTLNFEYSTDDVTYTPIPALDYTTPEAADASPAWTSTSRGVTIFGANVADGDALFLRWVSADAGGSGSRDEFGIDNVSVTVSSPSPDVRITPAGGSVQVTEGGATDTFEVVLSTEPTADVTVSIAPTLGQVTTDVSSVVFTPGNWNVPQTVTVTAIDDDVVEGPHTDSIAFTASSSDVDYNGLDIDDLVVNITDNDFVSLVAPYSNDFETAVGLAELGDGWTVFSVDADKGRTWAAGTTAENRYAGANAFGGSAPADDWLISPPFDLDATEDEIVSFQTWTRFTDAGLAYPELTLLHSTNFSGVGDPTVATWDTLSFTASDEDSQVWTDSGNIDISSISGTQVWFAFRYQSSGTGADSSTAWRVDDFVITTVGTPASTLSIASTDADKDEGNEGSTPFVFTVTRSGDLSGETSVDYAVTGTGEHPADANDFVGGGFPSGTITFVADETTKTITILVAGDTEIEPDETFLVTLSAATGGATLTTATATGIIRNDDFAPATELSVTAFTPNHTGFDVLFNREVETSIVNLYDQGGVLGPADVTLLGANLGAVAGTVVFNSSYTGFTFIKTGMTSEDTGIVGVLEPDFYTVTLRSAANGFVDLDGNLLRDAGGSDPGDYIYTFTVADPAPETVIVSIPDFARGFDQPVNVPGNAIGLPVVLSNGNDVGGVELQVTFDPTLLSITNFTTLIPGASASINTDVPGEVRVIVISAGAFAMTDGEVTLGSFEATVPATAPYGAKQVLRLSGLNAQTHPSPRIIRASNLSVIPSLSDDAVQVAGFLGDINLDEEYSAVDAILFQRIIIGVNSGTEALQMADPIIVGDLNNDGSLDAIDAILSQRLAIGTFVATVPELPEDAGSGTSIPAGPDPRLYIPTDLAADPGDTVTVPVRMEVTEATGIDLVGVTLAVSWDSTKLEYSSFSLGSLLVGAGFSAQPPNFNNGTPTGSLRFIATTGGNGTGNLPFGDDHVLVNFVFNVLPGAELGATVVNLRNNSAGTNTGSGTSTRLTNFDLQNLVLDPAPTNAATDAVDGIVTIGTAASTELAISATDAVKPEGDLGTTPFTFTVTRSGDTSGVTTVDYAVTGSGSDPADANDFDGGVLPSGTVTFAAGQTSQTVTVNVAGDYVVEPDEGFTVTLSNASAPATITTAAAIGTILNDDTAGIVIDAADNLITSEAGGTATFTVVLTSQPVADVVIGLSSSDETEGTVAPGSLTFTAANWNVPQTVTVTGVDDDLVDGHVGYTIVTAAAVSADANYSGLDGDDVPVTNLDDDGIGVFGATSVVIYRVGSGETTLVNTGVAVFLDEYAPHGALIQSIAMPTEASEENNNKQLIASGTATSEGLITLSADGQYLAMAGYGRDLGGTSSISGTAGTAVPRVVGLVSFDGTINTSTALSNVHSGNNIRGVYTTDGTDVWTAGAGSGSFGGVFHTTVGSTTGTRLSTDVTNLRGVHVFDGQLYVSTASGSAVRIGTVGAGTPTTPGQSIVNLPAFVTSGSPYQFFFADLDTNTPGVDTLYYADDAGGATGGLKKYSLVNGDWVLNGSVGPDGSSYRGLTGRVDGTSVTLFATRSNGELVSLVDASGHNEAFSGTPTLLASAGPNTAFRGVALAPQGIVDVTPPEVLTLSPPDDATDVPLGVNLVVTFIEDVLKGTGDILVRQSSDDAIVQTIDVASAAVVVAGAVVTIETADFPASTGLYVQIPATALTDLAANAFAGILDTTTWNFTTAAAPDTTPPQVTTLSPENGATGVAIATNLVMTFDENVQVGTGNIQIRLLDDSAVQTIDVTGTAVSVAGNVLTIDPPADLAFGTGYYIVIPGSAIEDFSGNAFAGFADSSGWSFTTIVNEAPTVDLNRTITMHPGQRIVISSAILSASDPENDPLTYTVTAVSSEGMLRNGANVLSVNGTFTQANVDDNGGGGQVTFESTGTEPASTTIALSLSDGVNTVPVTLTISIVAPSGPISFDGSAYQQNFDNLLPTPIPADEVTIPSAMVLPAGWVVVEAGDNANHSIRIDAGGRTTGDSYLYGATGSNERALGSLGSGSMSPVHFGTALVNTSGQTIASFSLSYVGEQWRRGSNNVDELTFAYSTTATSLTGTGFIEVNELGFFPVNTGDPQPPTGPLDGNVPENQTNISHEVTGVDWQAGEVLWIRWTDINSPSFDSGLAIDDVQFSATALANPTLTLTAPDAVYTSVAYAGASVTITGAADPEPEAVLTYYVGTEAIGTPLDSAPINVGTYTVVASTPANAANNAATSDPVTFSITAKGLTVTGFTSDDKVYDGNTDAVVSSWGTLVGVVSGDNVALDTSGASASFADANVGTWTVTAAGLTLGGTEAGNYSLTQPGDTSDITAKGLNATGEAADKVYDATTDAMVTISLSGVIGGDEVTGAASGTFDDKNVGTNKPVTIGAVALSGADAGNYTVGSAPNTTASITAAPLTVDANPASKVVNTPDPPLTYVASGFVGGETAATALEGTLTRDSGKDVGQYSILQGTLAAVAGNYAITFNGAIFEIVADAVPVAQDDHYEMDEDTVLVVPLPGVLDNDSDPAGGSLTAALCNTTQHGYLAFNPATGAFSYRPFENFYGQDTFTYFAVSGALRSDPATVTITVRPVNDPPVARDDLYTVVGGQTLSISAAGGVLANDTDVDGDVLTVRNMSAVTGGGSLTMNDDGSFTYTPDTGFTGTASFTYEAWDGQAGSTATVRIEVTASEAVPQVESVVINDGSAQRSMVQSLTVRFASVADLQAEHFRLVNRDTGAEVDLVFARDDASGKSVVTLMFTGGGIVGGSLADGNYLLTIDLEKDGIGVGDDHQFGASQADNFFRLFGDSDGDRDVDNLDYFRLRGALGHTSDSPRFLDYFDYDQDDDVDSDDLAEFLARFRTTLAWS